MALRFIFSVLAVLTFMGCQDLDRENPLDPKNPASSRQQIFLVEAFVNTSPQLETDDKLYINWAIQALDSIQDLYGEQMIIAEYHRNVTDPKYTDDLALPDRYETLYTKYINANGIGNKGVPDIYINGAMNRIQGAYSPSSVYDRINEILSEGITNDGMYTIEPSVSVNEGDVRVSCKIARLGNRSEQALRLRLIFIRDFGQPLLKHVVVAEDEISKYSKSINRLNAGEFIDITFDIIHFNDLPDVAILILSNQDETAILQSASVVL